MTATDDAFLSAIGAKPRDAAPRGIYADWLDDQGRAEEADRWRSSFKAISQRQATESWRRAWRHGFAKTLPLSGLSALRKALEIDDPRLIQGANTTPPPLMSVADWPVEAADAIGFCGWQDDGLGIDTVGEVEEFFARHCFEADQRIGEAGGFRWFLNWFDDTPRHEMRRELWAEVEWAIVNRSPSPPCRSCGSSEKVICFPDYHAETICPDCCDKADHPDGETGHRWQHDPWERDWECVYCGILRRCTEYAWSD